jgi:hypothetical protein
MFHSAAVQFMAGTSSTSLISDGKTDPDKKEHKTGVVGSPTAAQLRVAAEVVFSPLGAQGSEYQRRCESCRVKSPLEFANKNDKDTFYKIVQATATVLWDRDRDLFRKRRKDQIVMSCWAQDTL